MQNTTELEVVPAGAGGFPPPRVASSSDAPAPPSPPNQINQSPRLPDVAVPVPRPATATAANQFASSLNNSSSSSPGPKLPKRGGSARRSFSWFLILAFIGGLAYVGVTYGSDLMELATGEEQVEEPAAPLVFPVAVAVPAPIRTATFTVEQPDALDGPQQYEVTTDFENGISRVLIDRADAPDLEVLTVFDSAVIRRVDRPTWYRLDRGVFPTGFELGRGRWVRHVDELLPTALRSGLTIDQATESTVGADAARHLVLSLDPATVTQFVGAAAVTPADPAAPMPPGLPVGVSWQPGADGVTALTVEVWVDDAGTVRKSILPVELGGETITVTSVSPEAWQPVFPTDDMILPLTAAALFELCI